MLEVDGIVGGQIVLLILEPLGQLVESIADCVSRLGRFGNDDVQLTVLPGMEHYFVPVDPDPERRVWERITQATMSRPMAPEALEVLGRWAARTRGRSASGRSEGKKRIASIG